MNEPKVIGHGHPLFGALLKLERANCHLEELKADILAFVKREAYRLIRIDDANTGDLVFKIEVRERVPERWACPIGDCIHNFRAALDHITCQLVALGGEDCTKSQFPIFAKRAAYCSKSAGYLKGAPQDAIDLIESFQPYHGGDDHPLWVIHRLDILDKHRGIIPVGAAHRSVKIKLPGLPEDAPQIALKPADRQFPLRDGSEVYRILAAARKPEVDHDPEIIVEIAFGEGQVVDGRPVVEELTRLGAYTFNVIRSFEDILTR